MSRYRLGVVAGLLLATLSGLAGCSNHAGYPVQAAYAMPGPYATTSATVVGARGTAIYDEYYPARYAALEFKSPIVTWGNGTDGKPADTAVFLASDLGRGVTGNIIYVDSGFQIMGL